MNIAIEADRYLERYGIPKRWEVLRILASVCKTEVVEYQKMAELLAPVYLYLLPRPLPRPKSEFKWVAMARGIKPKNSESDESTPYDKMLPYIHVTKTTIEACDGNRLHRIPNTAGLKPGLYNDSGGFVCEDRAGLYPPIDRFIAKYSWVEDAFGIDWIRKWEVVVVQRIRGMQAYLHPVRKYGYSKQYLDAALLCPNSREPKLRFTKKAVSGPIQIDHGKDRVAVLMPIRFSSQLEEVLW